MIAAGIHFASRYVAPAPTPTAAMAAHAKDTRSICRSALQITEYRHHMLRRRSRQNFVCDISVLFTDSFLSPTIPASPTERHQASQVTGYRAMQARGPHWRQHMGMESRKEAYPIERAALRTAALFIGGRKTRGSGRKHWPGHGGGSGRRTVACFAGRIRDGRDGR
jgi:hypothetical protein